MLSFEILNFWRLNLTSTWHPFVEVPSHRKIPTIAENFRNMIPTADFIALLPLIGYFSFVVILHTFLPSPALRITTERTPRYALFLILAIISLGIT